MLNLRMRQLLGNIKNVFLFQQPPLLYLIFLYNSVVIQGDSTITTMCPRKRATASYQNKYSVACMVSLVG